MVIYEAFVEGKGKLQNISPRPSTNGTSNRSTKNSSRERSGVSLMRSPHLVFFFSSTEGTIHLLMG